MLTKSEHTVGFEMLVKAGEGNRRELIQTLSTLRENFVENTTSEVFEDVAHPDRFLIVQGWPSRVALDEYRRSAGFRTLLGAVQVLGSMEEMTVVDVVDRRETSIDGRQRGA